MISNKQKLWFSFILMIFTFFGVVHPLHAQQFFPIELEVEFTEPSPTPQPSETPSPPIASASPEPVSTPRVTPEPTPTVVPATPEPTPTPIAQGAFLAEPSPTPFATATPAPIPAIFQQIQDQFRQEEEPVVAEVVEEEVPLTPGAVITPIIPREVLDRIIPAGLYKDDGLNPIDGFALLVFGIGFIFAGIALLRSDIFLPALSRRNLFNGQKSIFIRQMWRRNSQSFMNQ